MRSIPLFLLAYAKHLLFVLNPSEPYHESLNLILILILILNFSLVRLLLHYNVLELDV